MLNLIIKFPTSQAEDLGIGGEEPQMLMPQQRIPKVDTKPCCKLNMDANKSKRTLGGNSKAHKNETRVR